MSVNIFHILVEYRLLWFFFHVLTNFSTCTLAIFSWICELYISRKLTLKVIQISFPCKFSFCYSMLLGEFIYLCKIIFTKRMYYNPTSLYTTVNWKSSLCKTNKNPLNKTQIKEMKGCYYQSLQNWHLKYIAHLFWCYVLKLLLNLHSKQQRQAEDF